MANNGTVLVVDDSDLSRELAEDTLRDAGFSVLLAENGQEGLRVARQDSPDVILLDRMMPGTSGDEICALLKADPELKKIKIIILSAKASAGERIEGLEFGADDYLPKPYEPQELVARVRAQSRTKLAEDALSRAYEEIEQRVAERTAELAESNRNLIREMADHKRAEEGRRLLSSAVEHAGESIVITDARGKIQYVNPAFEQISGYSRTEVRGKNPRFLKGGSHDKTFYRDIWKIIAAGNVWSGQMTNRTKGGRDFQVEMSISPIREGAGEITNYVAVQRDITKELQIEAQLRQAQKMEAIGVFTGGIAHDFNNILTPILSCADLLRKYLPDDQRAAKELDAIKTAGMRAKDLVSQILLFSRQKRTAQVPVKLNSIVKEVTKLLRSAIPTTIEIVSNVDPEVSIANADVTQIHTLVMNLATNASHAMPDGGELNISLGDVVLEDFVLSNGSKITGKHVHLCVADNGGGIDEKTLARIFEPFFTTKEVGSGTGLGLSTVFRIAEQHNGHVDVKSTVGEGTRFDIYLPALEGAGKQKTEERPATDLNGSESILLIDDEAAIVRSSSIALQLLGYQVSAFTSSKEALEAFWEDPSKFDLIVTDETMPYMTGTKVAEFVRRVRRDLPIVISTGYPIGFSPGQLEALGVKSILEKPYPIDDLARVIRRVLDLKNP